MSLLFLKLALSAAQFIHHKGTKFTRDILNPFLGYFLRVIRGFMRN